MSDLRVLGVIPARLQSTRLPRKVLREIAGKPLIVHVFEAARRASDLAELLVATDSDEVVSACAKFGIPTVMTSAEHLSGTDAKHDPANYVLVRELLTAMGWLSWEDVWRTWINAYDIELGRLYAERRALEGER